MDDNISILSRNNSSNNDSSSERESINERFIEENLDDSNNGIKDREKLCFGCDLEKIEFYIYNCGNGLCNQCNIEHVKAQLEKYRTKVFSSSIKFICPGSCKCLVEDNEKILSVMSLSHRTFYNEILFKMYISKANDIISCPISSCPFLGIIKTGCSEKYECNLCNHKWEEYTKINFDMCTLMKWYNEISISNIKSYFKKFIITKYCNNCNSPIEKNEGCKHIECNRCEYSFCWKCTENWKDHKELACMGIYSNEWEETFRPDFIPFLFFGVLFFFCLKFILTFTFIIKLFIMILNLAIFLALLFFNSFAVFMNANKLLKGERTQLVFFLKLLFLFTIEIILFYFKLHPFSEKWYYIANFTSIGLTLSIGFIKKSIFN